MILRIDANNGIAIYEQIVRQVKYAVANGNLRRDELLPSVRELSKQLTVNPNTVARAYRQLQDENVLLSIRGLGMQVAHGAERRCRSERKKLIAARMKEIFAEARQSGLTKDEVQKIIDKELVGFPENEETKS